MKHHSNSITKPGKIYPRKRGYIILIHKKKLSQKCQLKTITQTWSVGGRGDGYKGWQSIILFSAISLSPREKILLRQPL
jgi:hypothetical protein